MHCAMHVTVAWEGTLGLRTYIAWHGKPWRTFAEGGLRQHCMQVWHNYGFDKHILQRQGFGIAEARLRELGHEAAKISLSLAGFAGDTMHMARLHDAARKGTKTYSLASLTSDKSVMCSPDRSVLTRSKISLKELFSRPKMSKSGKLSSSLKELPPIHEVQV